MVATIVHRAAPDDGVRRSVPERAAPPPGAQLAGTEPLADEPPAHEWFSGFVAAERLVLAVVGIAFAHDGLVSRRCRR
jgi:hypothetical protein